ncbi:MAG: 6-pyruvoyl tetrahydrobiopterin synthase [Chloroflexi bacterium]|nr:6-pyruvoyl tetrahydrobiopterin synthase [Chloroflexota bacterium]MBT17462.1 6-pyruvoyl tetrahydrobiopterin synthase [Dehalococcoidia bacterium]|tara:strand:+ start:4120 stop:4533 length:414 start_codon:yes stop_codon:yes gene_type:complete
MEINNYKVSKGIHFCYGHRLLEYNGMCRYLHGHNAYLEIDISSNRLDQLGMVVDFNEIKDKAKNWIDQHVDHKMLLCDGDPIIPALKELGEPYFLMAENPTAENISKMLFREISNLGLKLNEIRLWETPSSYASYSE